eukprot:3786272-Prymnesium_polylepis.1
MRSSAIPPAAVVVVVRAARAVGRARRGAVAAVGAARKPLVVAPQAELLKRGRQHDGQRSGARDAGG